MNRSPIYDAAMAFIGLALLAVPAMGQQQDAGQTVISGRSVRVGSGSDGNGTMTVITDGVRQDFLIRPDGTYQVGADGSLQPVDSSALPSGVIMPRMAGMNPAAQPVNPNGPAIVNAVPGAVRVAQDPTQIRQRLLDSLKQALGCSDEEWAVLWPKIEKIQLLQGAAGETAAMPVPLSSGGTGGGASAIPLPDSVRDARAKEQEFQKAVNDPSTSDAAMAQALAALRQARQQARAELATARKELTGLVTQRQEAILYQRRILV